MDLQSVIQAMETGDGQTKTAAEAPSAESTNLDAALEKAAAPVAPASPVAEVDAVEALMKSASELAGTEKESEIAHAALCGQAFADGAISKLAAYDAQVQQAALQEPKIAAMAAPIAPAPAAEVDDELIKAAAEAGYQETLQKVAEEYKSGHDTALQEVHNKAATEFLKGAGEVEALCELAAQPPQG